MSFARTLYEIYFQDSTCYAKAILLPDGSVQYKTVDELPTLEIVQKHLDHKITIGAYAVSPGNTIRWISWDIDSKLGIEKAREIAKEISDFLKENNIPHAVEFSGSKGYHISGYLEGKDSAERGKRLGEELRDFLGYARSGQVHVEVYPKQSELKKGEVGSLLKLPLGVHPKTNREMVFVNTETWEDGDPLDPEIIFSQKMTLDQLEKALLEADPTDKIAKTLAPYWSTGQRHDITMCTAGMAATSGWTKEHTEELIEAIHELVPEGDLRDHLKAVDTTFRRYANNETILGENGLTSFIPAKVLMRVRSLMGSTSATLIMQSIDTIRLEKNPAFKKVRSAAKTAISYFLENGRLVRDEQNVFWLDYANHQLTMIDSYAWNRLTHNLLGINLSEGFGRQVAESIRHLAYEAAKVVIVVKRSYWHQKKLYINLGGPEIYILDGKTLEYVYNGEIDILFRNSDDTLCLPNLLEEEDNILDPWKMLVDDVNFKEGDTTVEQQKQLLIAYICAMFFPEALPTRPILMILGVSGSGKTTTARRILWLIEGTGEDVLGQVPDKPDALRATMAAHRMVVVDNIEKTSVKWFPDVLNRAATGSQIELRELHTTNRVQKIIFNVYMCLTGTEIPFSEEAVYTRILPIELKYLDVFQSEGAMRSNIANNFTPFWKGMLYELNKVVAELNEHEDDKFTAETRLADFAVFCNKIKGADFINGDELMKGLGNLVNRQKETLKEYSPFINILDGLIKTRPDEMGVFMTTSELYSKGQRYAAMHKQRFDWSTAQGLSKHIDMMKDQLSKHYGMIVKTDREGGREVKKYKFNVAVTTVVDKPESQEKMN